MFKVLVVDDDQGLRFSVKSLLTSISNTNVRTSAPVAGKPASIANHTFEVSEAFDGVDALEKVKLITYDIVLLDVDMPRMNGLEALKQIKEIHPGCIVIMMTAYANIDDAVKAVKDGAFNYLSKPVSGEILTELLDRAIKAHTLISNIAGSAPTMFDQGRKIIGNTAQMQKVFNIINRLSKVDTPVLIRGASGTGKELVARAIHYNSARKDEKFVAVNCSAIPENLFESEFFGHEKGAFTSADQRKIGKFQYAEGGTLFLDEVGDLPLHMQVKLLRVLQEKLFTPVGAVREIQTNVRIIAATNRNLEDMIKTGAFREDLFYRLNVIPIFLPALCERRDDIERLVHIFVKKFNQAHTKRISTVDPDAMSILKKYDWPGNIRELENVIEHCFIMENSTTIGLASLPEFVLLATGVNLLELPEIPAEILAASRSKAANADLSDSAEDSEDDDIGDEDSEDLSSIGVAGGDIALDFNAQKETFEKEFIIKALKTFKGRINQTALHANIPKKTLLRKIEKYGIIAKDFGD